MSYAQYLRVFCRIESRLAAILSDIPFSPSRADQYSEQISLLLLSTCPVVESFMAERAGASPSVQAHPIWRWRYAHKLWAHEKGNPPHLKEPREIQWGFPKFASVIREVFHIDQKTVSFFHNPVIRYVPGDSSTVSLLTPFAALFLILSTVDPDHDILEQNELLTTPPNDANCEVRSTLFRTQLIGT